LIGRNRWCNFFHIITIQILHLSNVNECEWECEKQNKVNTNTDKNTKWERVRSVCLFFCLWIELDWIVCVKTKQNKSNQNKVNTHSLTNWINKFTFNSKSLMWYTFSFGLDSISFLNISDRE
jgi:hypothetical protein